ncbi:MAG: hypothetical protein AB7E96_04570 [Deferribacterales bacterium]
MVYKVQKKLINLMSILFLLSFFFTYSVYRSDFSAGAMAVCAVMIAFLGYNLAVLLSKRFEVDNGIIHQTTLYGKKEIDLKDLEEIGVVNLRWRIILILSDPHKFVFISSLYQDFEDFISFLKSEVPENCKGHLDKVTIQRIRRKNMFLIMMLALGSLFFLMSGFYNIIYR